MKTVMIFLFGLIIHTSAFAADHYLLSVRAEKTGDKTAHLGIRTGRANTIEAVIYREHGETKPKVFEVKAAKNNWVVMVSKYMINVAKFKVEDASSTQLNIRFRYLYEYKGLNFTYHEKMIAVALNPATGRYEALDQSRPIENIFAKSHFVNGEVKGIDEIQAW